MAWPLVQPLGRLLKKQLEAIPQLGYPGGLRSELRRLPQRHDVRHLFRPGPATPLVTGSTQETVQPRSVSDIEGPDPLGCVALLPGDRQEIDPEVINPGRDSAHRLRGVAVKGDLVFPGHGADLSQRLNAADLVVGAPDSYQYSSGGGITPRTASGSTLPLPPPARG